MKMTCYWRAVLMLFVILLAFALRIYRIDFQSVWWDEGHSIFVASQPIPQIPTLPAMDVHPPAYFATLHLWMDLAGRSEFALRYLSTIFSLLIVALLGRFAADITRRLSISSGVAALLAALFAALSPLYIAYAQEIRSYTMITFLALASTYTLWQIIFSASSHQTIQTTQYAIRNTVISSPNRWLILYILATAACLYTHYFTVFLLLFQNLVWIVWMAQRNQRHRAAVWLTAQFGSLLIFSPQLLLAVRQVTSYTNPNLTPPTLSHFISQSWQAYTVGLTIDPTLAWWAMVGIAAILIISWGSLFLLHPKLSENVNLQPFGFAPFNSVQDRQDKFPISNLQSLISIFLFLTTWLLVPLGAYFLVLQRQPSFEPRYLMLITPAIFLLLAIGTHQVVSNLNLWCLRKLWNADDADWTDFRGSYFSVLAVLIRMIRSIRVPFFVVALLLYALQIVLIAIPIIVFITGAHSYFTNPTYFKDDSAGVARWLAAKTTANDIVYIDVPHPFHYYAEQQNIPARIRYLFVDIHTAADTLNREAAHRDRLFWVTWWGSDTDPRGVIPFLAQKAGQPLGQQEFKGYRVQWFDLPDNGATFSLPDDLTPANATFGDVLRLDGIAFGEVTTPVTEPVWATLHFTLLHETAIDYKVSLRLRDEQGQIVSQLDKDLLNDRHFRTSAWPLDDPALNQAINVYTLPLPPDTSPGSYQLEAVVYNAQPPYPSEGVSGHKNSDGVSAMLGTITIVP